LVFGKYLEKPLEVERSPHGSLVVLGQANVLDRK
jgi:hypothetical protein